MRKQLPLLIVYLFFFTYPAIAQNLNREYLPGINFGTPKSVVIDTITSQLKTYFETDTDDILKFVRKKYGVNINNKKKLGSFITAMQDDVRTLLQTSPDWLTVDTHKKYGFFISKILGKHLMVPGYGKAGVVKNGSGNCELTFKDDYVSGITGNLETTKEYTLFSGFNYDNAHLSSSANVLKKNYGEFTFKQSSTIWNSCSTNPENVPIINYFFNNDDDFSATFTFTYGIYQQKIAGSKSQCRAAGNHLTSIDFSIFEK